MERDEEGSVQRAFYAKSRSTVVCRFCWRPSLPCESIRSRELGRGAVSAFVMPTFDACNGGEDWVIDHGTLVADPKPCHTWPSRSDRLTGVNGVVFSGVVV